MGGRAKLSGPSEPFQRGGDKTQEGVMEGLGWDPRGMRLRHHFKEMPPSGCPAKAPDRALLVGWALWASGVACWGVQPAHCLANE